MKLPIIIKKRKNKRERSLLWKIIKFLLFATLILTIVGFFIGIYVFNKVQDDLSASIQKGYDIVAETDRSDFNTRYPTVIYDKDGKVLKKFTTNQYVYKKYKDINQEVFNALIAIEDERFYQHAGFDLKGFMRGLYSTVVRHDTQGGSTITQQLVKNIYLTNEISIWRKVTEAVIAQEIEKIYSKEDILEFYVNNVNYANGCYSIESAARYYFQKSTKDLSIAEIALITGIPNNPTLYNPVKKFENAIKKKNTILYKMYQLGMLTKEEYETEKARKIKLNVKNVSYNNEVSDYAQSFAVHKAVESLMKEEGFQFKYDFNSESERASYKSLYNDVYADCRVELLSGGYEIYTCIDNELQKQLQSIVDSQLSGYTSKDKSTKLYQKQAAASVIDNETGMVVAIIGGRSQKGISNSYNRAYLSARQPGSVIKPLIAYTPAYELGYKPSDKMEDAEIPNGPKNATKTYAGMVTLRYAVEKSINTIAYHLCNIVTPEVGVSKLATMRFRNLSSEDKKSPIIGVGGFTYGTNPVEMSSAYSALVRNGQYIEPTNVTKIVKRNTKEVVYENKHTTTKVYDDGASYLMIDSMKDVMRSGTGKRYQLNYKYQAGKTGTTNQSKDVWLCGVTPYYAMTVWVGNDTPAAQYSMSAQGMIYKKMMDYLHKGKEVIDFTRPSSVKEHNGILSYSKEQSENIKKDRTKTEIERKEKEASFLKHRLALLDYKIIYGLTEEEEQAREKIVEQYLEKLNTFSFTKSSQYEEIKDILSKTKEAIDKVKIEKHYISYLDKYNSLSRQFESRYYSLLASESSKDSKLWDKIISKKNAHDAELERKRQEEEEQKRLEEEEQQQHEPVETPTPEGEEPPTVTTPPTEEPTPTETPIPEETQTPELESFNNPLAKANRIVTR